MSVAVGNIMSQLATKAVAAIGNFVKDSINKGSELAELQNVVDSVFTTMSDKVETFSQNALAAYGLTEAQAKKMMGTYGAMSKSFGYSEQQAYNMSAALTGLTGDVASFYNLNHDEAYTKLKSVFTGETESLKELGVVMTQTALDEFALANGFNKTTRAMSEQEKVALRLAFVQDKLATASGDFTRNQNSWANQTRILTGQFESLKAAFGQGLINVLTPVIRVINTIMAKLVQLANSFKSFTEMITGKSSGGGAGDAMKKVADAAGEAAKSTAGVENAAGGAASAAKKAQKALMGFDEINKLQKNDDSGSSGGGSGASFDDIDFGSAVEEQEKKTNASISAIANKMKELGGLFKEGFKDGLGTDFEASLQRIKGHITGIGTSLKSIFTDSNVKSAASNWIKSVVYALGQGAGSLTSIGLSLGEMLIGGVDTYLKQNKGYIKQRLVELFNASAEIWQIAGNLSTALASIFEVFRGPTAKQATADLIGILVNSQLGIQTLAAKLGADIINLIAKPIIDNKDKIKIAIENTLKPVSTILSTLNTAVKNTFGKLIEVYGGQISPMLKSFADGISKIAGTVLDAYNTYIAPVLQKLANKFSEVWTSKIQPTINKAIELIGKVATLIKTLWETVLQPLITWIVENVVPVVAPVLEEIGSLFITVFGGIADVISGLFETLGGLIDFITGVFSGDWEKAWNGIKSIFTGIWNAIKSVFTTVWNVIKGVVSTALKAIKAVITTVFNGIKSLVTTIWNGIKGTVVSIWNGIKTAATTVWNGIKSVITTVVTTIKTKVVAGFNAIKTGVTTVINGIKSVITSVFNGIKSFLKGIVNGIISFIQGMVNGVIKGCNMMINALNKLSFDVPDWVPLIGGKKFGFNIKNISEVKLPRLAQGGYVKANQPQPVIIGDNKTQGEIVSPEGKMLEVMLQALETFFSKLQQSGYKATTADGIGDIVIPIYLDGTLLDEVIVTAQQRRNLRSGGR